MRANDGVEGWASRLGDRAPWIIAAIAAATAAALGIMGRSAICPCGHVALWHGTVESAENSQQLLDWYSLTHLVHGLLFYAATWAVLRRWPWRSRLVVAVAIEAAWEVLENSPMIIDRYRSVTMAWGYTGDSIVNALADIGCMIAGFAVAWRLPAWAGAAVVVTLELAALLAIRDNLALNLLMLIRPVDAVRAWQAG